MQNKKEIIYMNAQQERNDLLRKRSTQKKTLIKKDNIRKNY